MLEIRVSSCFPSEIMGVYIFMAFLDAAIAVLAFCQLLRIHSRSAQLGWTRQKVFHLVIGICNLGYVIYFMLTLIAACEALSSWSSFFGFVFMAIPKILFFAAFLLLLSYWVDLCHQADDEEDEGESSFSEALLDKSSTKPAPSNTNSERRCLPIPSFHVGSRQRVVILVTIIGLVTMIAFAVLIWIGMGKNPIDSFTVARVYVDIYAIATLLLGGALACYGILLYLKMSKVRYEGASSEMWKVTGLAVVSVVCFTTSALVALLSDIPVLYRLHRGHMGGVGTSLLLFLYYCIGFSAPSAFMLWVMRDLPQSRTLDRIEESRIVTYINDRSTGVTNPQRWTAVASLKNQGLKVSPI